jgi:hypothetical protein
MTLTLTQKTALGISGATALGIGAVILAAPHAFYASYGIMLGSDPSLLSELRAPGAGLAASGAIMLAGIFRHGLALIAVVFALAVFLAFPAGRIVGIAFDGMPSTGILAALALELAIAALCLFAFRPGASPAQRRTALR